jgi:hypothetical protein
VIGIELLVESGLKELKGGGIIGGGCLWFHRIESARCGAKKTDILEKPLQIVTPLEPLAIG